MPGIAIAIALQFAGPRADGPVAWSAREAMPAFAWRGGLQGAQRLAVTTDSLGRPVACVVTMSSGSEKLKAPVCRHAMRHARFRPAVDEHGVAVPGVYTDANLFGLQTDAPPRPIPYDLAVAVARLPAGAAPLVTIAQLVEADGRVAACKVEAGSGNATLDALACRHATTLPVDRIADASGRPVRGVVRQTVLFTDDAPR